MRVSDFHIRTELFPICVALICIYSHILASPASNTQRRICQNKFLPLDAMLARYMPSSCVCTTVSLSQAGIVSKPLNTESRKQHHTIAQGLYIVSPSVCALWARVWCLVFLTHSVLFWRQWSRQNSTRVNKNRRFSTIDSLYPEDGTRQTHRSTDRQTDWHRTVT